MKRMALLLVLIIIQLFIAPNLMARDPFKGLDAKWKIRVSDLNSQWDRMEADQKEKWARLKADVERKWDKFVHSTNKDWVSYSPEHDARSRVDFEKGKIVIEAIVPEDDPKGMEKAGKMVEDQAEKIFKKKDPGKKRVLGSQVKTSLGKEVKPANLKKYLKDEVLPDVKPDPLPFKSRDGVERRKYTAHIELVPQHIRIRAERYLPVVEKNAARFNLKPQLILAVIHTESYFNPMALSGCNAVGIMQIIPRYAGKEAYRFIYHVDKPISHEYLYDPENNIELGAAYLHLLKYRYFKDVPGELKNRYVFVCGYNWGPTIMRKKIVNRFPISTMSDEQVYMLLREKTPRETADYIKKVRERMPIYDPFFDRG